MDNPWISFGIAFAVAFIVAFGWPLLCRIPWADLLLEPDPPTPEELAQYEEAMQHVRAAAEAMNRLSLSFQQTSVALGQMLMPALREISEALSSIPVDPERAELAAWKALPWYERSLERALGPVFGWPGGKEPPRG